MLIGLHGKKQAGKDTVYERLVARVGAGSTIGARVERVSFADKLYESAAAALGVTVDFLQARKSDPTVTVAVLRTNGRPEAEVSVREYLQRFGTEAHRDIFGTDFWVDNVDLAHEGRIVVVTDVRFRNEARAIIDAGGTVVQVIGPEDVENAGDGHASEERLPSFLIDDVIWNTVRDDDFCNLDTQVLELAIGMLEESRRCA